MLKNLADQIGNEVFIAVFACGTDTEIGTATVQTLWFILAILK